MSLRCMVRVGRWWLNPRYLIRVEDPAATAAAPDGDHLIVTMECGEEIVLRGQDAETLRRRLTEARQGRAPDVDPVACEPPRAPLGRRPRRTGSGRSPRPRPEVERDQAGTGGLPQSGIPE